MTGVQTCALPISMFSITLSGQRAWFQRQLDSDLHNSYCNLAKAQAQYWVMKIQNPEGDGVITHYAWHAKIPYVYCRCSFAMLLLRSGVSGCLYLTRTSPDITSLPVVVLSYGHRRCHVHLTSAVFAWKNHAHHVVLRQPMYLSTPRRIFQTIFGNVRKFTFFHISHGHN